VRACVRACVRARAHKFREIFKEEENACLKQLNLHCEITCISPSSVHRKCVSAFIYIYIYIYIYIFNNNTNNTILTDRRISKRMWIQHSFIYDTHTQNTHSRYTGELQIILACWRILVDLAITSEQNSTYCTSM